MKDLEVVQRRVSTEKESAPLSSTNDGIRSTIPGHKDIDDVLNQFVAFEQNMYP